MLALGVCVCLTICLGHQSYIQRHQYCYELLTHERTIKILKEQCLLAILSYANFLMIIFYVRIWAEWDNIFVWKCTTTLIKQSSIKLFNKCMHNMRMDMSLLST